MSTTPQVTLESSDGEKFKVDKEVAERSVLIKNMIEGTRRFCHRRTCRGVLISSILLDSQRSFQMLASLTTQFLCPT